MACLDKAIHSFESMINLHKTERMLFFQKIHTITTKILLVNHSFTKVSSNFLLKLSKMLCFFLLEFESFFKRFSVAVNERLFISANIYGVHGNYYRALDEINVKHQVKKLSPRLAESSV